MQRRAAAVYFVFFLVVAAGAWAYVGVAQNAYQPDTSVSGTTFENGTTQTIGGVEYTLTDIGHSGGGDHGGGGGALEATLNWTNPEANQTATLEHDASITYEGTDYTLVVPNESDDPSSFTLEEEQNVSALLAADDAVENEVAEQNGTQYVVYSENRSLRPLAEWLPEPETREFSEGDDFEYENATTTVASVDSSTVTLQWVGPLDQEADLTEGGNVTLADGETYFAHFPSENAVTLAPQSQYPAYAQSVAEQSYFAERMAGLWGVAIISAIAGLLVLSIAYLPSRG